MRSIDLNLLAHLGVPRTRTHTPFSSLGPSASNALDPSACNALDPSASNALDPSASNASDNVFDPAHAYVSSPLLRDPLKLAAARLAGALYALTTLVVTLVWNVVVLGDGDSYFSYFTYLTYTGLTTYYIAAGIQTLAYALRVRRAASASSLNSSSLNSTSPNSIQIQKGGSGRGSTGYPLQRWPRILQALHVVLQATVVTFPLVVTVVFWALLADGTTFASAYSSWSNISVHALNTLFALCELLGTHAPPAPWAALPLTLALLAAYLGVAYITRAAQGFYPYPFLDPATQHGMLAAYIIGIAAAQALAFAAARGLAVLRVRWAARAGLGPHTTVGGGMDGRRRVVGGRGEVCVELEGGWAMGGGGGGGKEGLEEGKGKASVESV